MSKQFYGYREKNNILISEKKPVNFDSKKNPHIMRVPNKSIAKRLYEAKIKIDLIQKDN